MDDPIKIMFDSYYPTLRKHVLGRYGSMRTQHCLLNPDDLMQEAAIVLIRLGKEWPSIVENFGASENPAEDPQAVWGLLSQRVEWAILAYRTRVAKVSSDHRVSSIDRALDAGDDQPWLDGDDIRTALRVPDGSRLEWGEIVDAFTMLPQRHKAHLALRFFDRLGFSEMADLLGRPAWAAKDELAPIRNYLRAAARNQYLEHPGRLPGIPLVTEPLPQALHDYLRTKYDLDVYEWLGLFAICLRKDVSYLVDILGTRQIHTEYRGTLTPEQRAEIERRYGSGQKIAQIARELQLTRRLVETEVHRAVA